MESVATNCPRIMESQQLYVWVRYETTTFHGCIEMNGLWNRHNVQRPSLMLCKQLMDLMLYAAETIFLWKTWQHNVINEILFCVVL